MTDHGGISHLSCFDGGAELWRRGARRPAVTVGQTLNHQTCVLLGQVLLGRTCAPTVIQGFAEHVRLPASADFIDPIEDFSEEDSRFGSMAVTGRSPEHPRTDSEDNGLDVGALLEKVTDHFSACMNAKVDSMMDRLEKRIDDKIDSKLGPVMDRLTVLEKSNTSSTRSGPSSSSHNGGSAGGATGASDICTLLSGNQGVVRFSRSKHAWSDRGSGKAFHDQDAIGNWLGSGLFDSTCGSQESQEYEDHMLLEKSKPLELQAD